MIPASAVVAHDDGDGAGSSAIGNCGRAVTAARGDVSDRDRAVEGVDRDLAACAGGGTVRASTGGGDGPRQTDRSDASYINVHTARRRLAVDHGGRRDGAGGVARDASGGREVDPGRRILTTLNRGIDCQRARRSDCDVAVVASRAGSTFDTTLSR